MDIPTPSGPVPNPLPSPRSSGRLKTALLVLGGVVGVVAIGLAVLTLVFRLDLGLVALVALAVLLGLGALATPYLPPGIPGIALMRRVTGGLLWLVVVVIAYLYVYPQLRA